MKDKAKVISPAIYGIALICFFLPFIDVSCSGQKIGSFTGIQLVTGITIEQSVMWEEGRAQKVDREPLAIAAFISAFMGLGLSFIKSRKSSIAPAVMGAAGVILLLLLKSKIDSEVLRQGEGMIQVEYGIGFWLTFLSFLSAAVLNVVLAMQSKGGYLLVKNQIESAVETGATNCPNCGAAVKAGAKFCRECGTRLLPSVSEERAQADQLPDETEVCPKCGAKVKEGAKFCKECGARLTT